MSHSPVNPRILWEEIRIALRGQEAANRYLQRVDFRCQQWYSIFAQEARTRFAERTEVHLTAHRSHEHLFCLQMRTIRHMKKGRSS